jgi:hypothetical protein
MAAQNSAALIIEKGTLYVGDNAGNLVNLGSVRKVMFTGKQQHTKVDSDNNGTVLNKLRLIGEIAFDWLEPGSISNMENLFRGAVTKATVAGTSTPVTGEVTAAGSWAYSQPILFAKQAGDTTVPTSITVTGGTDGALTVNTNYILVQDPGTKRWGVMIKSGGAVTTLNQTITLAYTVTPNTALTLTGGTNLTMTPRYVRIVGPSEANSNVTRQIDLAASTVTSDMLLPFVDVETANDVGVMPVKCESNKGSTWTWTDQVNPN